MSTPVRTPLSAAPVQLLPADSVSRGEEPEELLAQRLDYCQSGERLEVYWQTNVLMPSENPKLQMPAPRIIDVRNYGHLEAADLTET
jgi:hypothetical protein